MTALQKQRGEYNYVSKHKKLTYVQFTNIIQNGPPGQMRKANTHISNCVEDSVSHILFILALCM